MPRYDERGTFLGNDLVQAPWRAEGPDDGKARAADMVAKAMTPADQGAIEEWLTELSLITARRQDDDFTETLRLDAYSRRLAEYPADVAKSVLLDRRWKWWPTWAELAEACDDLVADRRAMAAALVVRPDPNADDSGDGEPRVTAERTAEILAEVGFSAKRFGGAA